MCPATPEALNEEGHHLLLACFPKSGSTYLTLILAELPGFQRVSLVPGYHRREAELSVHRLAIADRNFPRFVAKHHVRFSEETMRLLEIFSLKPIVLVRNIFDVVASVRDHLRREPLPMAQAYVPADAPEWDNQRLEQFIADMIVPWFFNFYASWAECSGRIELTYEELTTNTQPVLSRLLKQLNIDVPNADLQRAIQAAQDDHYHSRFHVGLSGRGCELNALAIARIHEIATYYSFMDLSAIGLQARHESERSVSAEAHVQTLGSQPLR